MRASFINTSLLLATLFLISPLAAGTTTTTNNSIYASDTTTQKVIDSRKASNDSYYQGLQSITREAQKARPRSDPDYIEPKYLKDLIKYAQRNWPGNYQMQYSFLSAELSYYKETKQKSWYVYHDPPRGISTQKYDSMKKIAYESAPRNWPEQRYQITTQVIAYLNNAFLFGSCLDALSNANAIIVDANSNANYIVAKLPINGETTAVKIQGEDFLWTPTHVQIKINILSDDLKLEPQLIGYIVRVNPKSEHDKKRIPKTMPATKNYTAFLQNFKNALINDISLEIEKRKQTYKDYHFW
ncbi:MAG: hypothetical protein COZ46_02955 [Verrucomicrobia bacterium CG_4_10_14_3_um_filter_43_23]|nr:MAG: hypothetical protein AUJ82_01020 [Verrucomicrobia bacterium CG1_02_43_26]PIP59478.1 MAG: hypothetical protein COX01_02580 [Verrucomicrobia bacterium CG22_combo_CG10-13_8_21_14_all_43_17]PIX58639.1 MAG: hypothetical protein COZ46_02955 [Verrucomicrobia bacterium CG_4_10_14_3_um_filter_43_23]PIY61464.1 MAG: hypothetical protein COY94_05320 [Verrucomicrobia bacterium CG_4_10_14_0_8_um_filter_43_34]PJA43831.1 MAG: hypothetical protein CO175_06240 [Verrucomicrobia bacterium CG_4_9_14_3_um_fi